MATCEHCKEDMLKVRSCPTNHHLVDDQGTIWETIPFILFREREGRLSNGCHDCNVQIGARHHHNCDMERCPKCGNQLISCDCVFLPVDQ
ncbi:hypothetical protein LCGC14_1838840 [marine sediment metagenome]|uniref:Uncharacterized protein n=1 Tax=marine sediment metagenome TaxID=412755 RepID=A0A0F9H203_9ZZZZ